MKQAIGVSRSQDYAEWYQEVIKAADLAEHSPARGCMIIKPWGYAIWEKLQKELDQKIKAMGHDNVYFPLFIPLSFLEKEATHVEGFAKECAVVTHHRLEKGKEGKLVPAAPLEEPYIVRPTSEMIIGEAFSRWIQSYRDLPLKMNQWANVVRWEMRTRLFLRTCEILWQEGHTAHAHRKEAEEHARKMLRVYEEVLTDLLALAPICGTKSRRETFPGAETTYTLEMMMQDGKALQGGTSHFLGQNFSKSCQIQFQTEEGKKEYAWTTSWGVTTRLVGAMIMTHSDDDGLVLPPKVAPKQIVILPIFPKAEEKIAAVKRFCAQLYDRLSSLTYAGEPLRVQIDERDLRGGEKNWSWVKKGVPIRLEIGGKEVEENKVSALFRHLDVRQRQTYSTQEFIEKVVPLLQDMQKTLTEKAIHFQQKHTKKVNTKKEFYTFFEQDKLGFVLCNYQEEEEIENQLQQDLSVTLRCFPWENSSTPGPCIFSGAPGKLALFAKAY